MFSRLLRPGKRSLESLSEQEILALAISSEEDDGRIYLAYADALRGAYPNSARVFEEMAAEGLLPSPTGASLVLIGAALLGVPMWYLLHHMGAIVDVVRQILFA